MKKNPQSIENFLAVSFDVCGLTIIWGESQEEKLLNS